MAAATDPKDDKTLLQKAAGKLVDFGQWMVETFIVDPHGRALNALVDDLGGTLKAPPSFPTDLDLAALKSYIEAPRPSIEAWIGGIRDIVKLVECVRAIKEAVEIGGEPAGEEFVQSAIDLLASNYVRERWFHLFVWMELLRFSTEPMTLYGPQGTAGQRFYGSLKSLVKFALGPIAALCEHPLQTEADAQKLSDETLLHLAAVFAFVGNSAREIGLDAMPEDEHPIRMFYGWDEPAGALSEIERAAPAADQVSQRMLSVQLRALPEAFQDGRVAMEGALRLSAAWVPAEHGGPGLFVSVGGSTFRFFAGTADSAWAAQADVRFDAPFGVQIGGQENFRIDGPLGEGALHADFALASKAMPAGERRFHFSLGGDNGLAIGRIGLSGTLNTDEARAQLSFYDCRLALDGAAFDDFIGSLLPKTQTSVEFSFGVGISTRDGVFLTSDLSTPAGIASAPSATPPAAGAPAPADANPALVPPDLPVASTGVKGSGIPIQIPIGKSLGPIRLNRALVNLDRDTSGSSPKALIQAAFSFSAQIGPVLAAVDLIGVKLALDFPDDPAQANLHFVNVDVGFVPPAGIGLAVDAKSVKGGGFLFRDEAKHQYAGVMELSLSGVIALKAIGLLTTRMPDGTKGYSLIVLVTAQTATPNGALLQLPLGWRLTGIGGLIAIHRTVNEDALRAGLKNHTLESILFPKDPVRNAPTVIAALERVFPAKRGSYLFGLMVQLQWGAPTTLIELNLGLILELGGRNRFVVLGRMSAALPRFDNDLLRLNLDAVGIFDFDQGTVAIDAVMVDSRLLHRFPLTGSGALRARWTSPRSFALAVGGMHHAFTPPAGFPALERLAVSFTTGDNPRLTCDAYFALTANTVQFGAHAHLYASAYGFNVVGEAGFDVLIQLLPFHFLAEFFASMQLRKGSSNLFKVKVEGALEGPLPLSVRAKCSFEIFWWDVSIRVNVTLVGGAAPPVAIAVDAFAQLRTALSDPKSWSADLPAGQTRIVSLRDAPAAEGTLRVHPLGTLAVRQSVVPLNAQRDIDKLGDAPVAGARRFQVTGVSVGSGTATPAEETPSPIADDFAPAQFFDMSDDAKLTGPSFEPMQAGLRIGVPEFTLGFAQRIESPLDYETRVIDRKAAVPPPPPSRDYRLSEALLQMHARHGAAGRSALRREARAPVTPFAKLAPARFAAVGAELTPLPAAPREVTFAEASAAATRTRDAMVVREFELEKLS